MLMYRRGGPSFALICTFGRRGRWSIYGGRDGLRLAQCLVVFGGAKAACLWVERAGFARDCAGEDGLRVVHSRGVTTRGLCISSTATATDCTQGSVVGAPVVENNTKEKSAIALGEECCRPGAEAR